jgi:hypothetical protein
MSDYKLIGKCGKYLPNCYIIKQGSREFYLMEYQLPLVFSIKEIRKFKLREIQK